MTINQVIEKLPDIEIALRHYLSTKDHAELREAYQLLTDARLAIGEQIKQDKQK